MPSIFVKLKFTNAEIFQRLANQKKYDKVKWKMRRKRGDEEGRWRDWISFVILHCPSSNAFTIIRTYHPNNIKWKELSRGRNARWNYKGVCYRCLLLLLLFATNDEFIWCSSSSSSLGEGGKKNTGALTNKRFWEIKRQEK